MSVKHETAESSILAKSQQLDAISWAARNAGMSYGKFSARLTEAGKERIYTEYARLLAAKRKEEQRRLAESISRTK